MKTTRQILNTADLGGVINQETAYQQRDEDIERKILLALKGIRYGSVEIVIHNSRVVQIERREKIRFDTDGRGKG